MLLYKALQVLMAKLFKDQEVLIEWEPVAVQEVRLPEVGHYEDFLQHHLGELLVVLVILFVSVDHQLLDGALPIPKPMRQVLNTNKDVVHKLKELQSKEVALIPYEKVTFEREITGTKGAFSNIYEGKY